MPASRRTSAARPVWTLPGAFGHAGPVSLKLEFLQHAGSFKARGAFNTLLSQRIPAAGVAAASGGNHGAAVAYAAQAARRAGAHLRAGDLEPGEDRGHPLARGRGGDRRRALRGCAGGLRPLRGRERGAAGPPVRGRSDHVGQGTVGARMGTGRAAPRYGPGGGGRRRADQRHRKLVGGPRQGGGRGARGLPRAACGARSRRAGRRGGGFGGGRFARAPAMSASSSTRSAATRVDHVALVTDEAIRDAQARLWRDWRIASGARRGRGAGGADLGRLQARRRASASACFCAAPTSTCPSSRQCRPDRGSCADSAQVDAMFPTAPHRRLPRLPRFERFPARRAATRRSPRRASPPTIMVIGCCDSRVSPEVIFDASPGELFVVRNVANLVPPYETGGEYHGTSAALEFAVQALRVKHIVVLGPCPLRRHPGLRGRVRAALAGRLHRPLDEPDRAGRRAPSGPRRRAISTSYLTRLELAAIENSLRNLMTFPCVRILVERGKLQLHGAYFGVATGVLMVRDPETGAFTRRWRTCRRGSRASPPGRPDSRAQKPSRRKCGPDPGPVRIPSEPQAALLLRPAAGRG